jgi:hypothetical protein
LSPDPYFPPGIEVCARILLALTMHTGVNSVIFVQTTAPITVFGSQMMFGFKQTS